MDALLLRCNLSSQQMGANLTHKLPQTVQHLEELFFLALSLIVEGELVEPLTVMSDCDAIKQVLNEPLLGILHSTVLITSCLCASRTNPATNPE